MPAPRRRGTPNALRDAINTSFPSPPTRPRRNCHPPPERNATNNTRHQSGRTPSAPAREPTQHDASPRGPLAYEPSEPLRPVRPARPQSRRGDPELPLVGEQDRDVGLGPRQDGRARHLGALVRLDAVRAVHADRRAGLLVDEVADLLLEVLAVDLVAAAGGERSGERDGRQRAQRRRRRAQPQASTSTAASPRRGSGGSSTGAACIARRRTSRQLTPSLSRAGAPMTNAVAISTACRMIP